MVGQGYIRTKLVYCSIDSQVKLHVSNYVQLESVLKPLFAELVKFPLMDVNLKKKSMQAVIDYQFAPPPSYSEAVAEVKGAW